MITSQIIQLLKSIVGAEHVSTAQDVIVAKSQDALKQVFCADAVVFPRAAEEIAAIMRLANEHRFYVTVRGGGVGYTGGAVPVRGGVVLATERMNRILEINKADLVAVVEPAVTNYQLQKAVEAEGLFYPPDPSSWKESFIGGNIALNAGGPRCVKYGNTKQFVLGLDFVTPTGEIIESGGRVPKNATGFHLESLLIGSEGMLGVITRCILRLLPLPEARRTALAVFESASDACDCVADFTSSGILPVSLELLDRTSINAIEDYEPSGLPRNAGALLIIEVDGLREAVAREAEIVREMLRKHRAIQFREAANDAEAVRRIFEEAVELGGTISGEHGVGYAKAPFFDLAVKAPAVELMKTIKRAMDPNGVLNPGKVFESALDAHQVGFVNSDQACC